jgi:hypothetical protein
MERENDIVRELQELGSKLGLMDRSMPYRVPAGYFEGLADEIQGTINELAIPDVVPAWSKTMPQGLPAGYFENLAGNIMATVRAEEAANSWPNEMPMAVPAGYFESLPAKVLAAVKVAEPVKKTPVVKPLKKTYVIRNVRWAAAAILLICVSVGGYVFFGGQPTMPEQMLASVPANEIHEYLQGAYRIDMDQVINNDNISNLQLDNKEIIEYLNETGWDAID